MYLELIHSHQNLLRSDYNALGDVETITYADNSTKEFTYYPEDNRLKMVTLPSGVTVEYSYDAAGVERRRVSSLDGEVIYNWNSQTDRLLSVTDTTGTTTYHYDETTGLFAGLDYPNGGSVRYEHDPLGRVEKVIVKASADANPYVTEYKYDGVGNIERIIDPNAGETVMVYDGVNRLISRQLPNGVKTVYTYKENTDLIEKIVHWAPDEVTVLASVEYVRTGIGEPTKIISADGAYVELDYDDSLRVTSESYYDASGNLSDKIEYDYDEVGNRLVVEGGVASGSYDYSNVYQLEQIETLSGVETYTYDAGGRVATVTRDGETLRLEYNTDDMLTKIVDGNGNVVVEYEYDSQGRRVEMTDASGERDYLVAPAMGTGLESPLLVVDPADNTQMAYVYSGLNPIMRLDENGEPVYYLTDAMGSVIGLVDGAGKEVASFEYDSFGNLRNLSGTAAEVSVEAGGDFRFQGQWLESNTDLYHFRARYYDPQTGRFLSRDPVELIEYEPESSNPYQFVYNNPHVYSDPSGEFTITELNASQNIQTQLANVRRYVGSQAKDYLLERLGDAFGNVVMSVLNNLVPGTSRGQSFNIIYSGDIFEQNLEDTMCEHFEGLPLMDSLWFWPRILNNGEPQSSGWNCGGRGTYHDNYAALNSLPGNKPDFQFRQGGANRLNNPNAYLISDIKLILTAAYSDVTLNDSQWQAMSNYARKYQLLPFVSYIALLETKSMSAGISKSQRKKMAKEALEKGVILLLANLI